MSLYRTIIAAVAAMGLGFATSALAADDAATNGQANAKAIQSADAATTTTTGTTTTDQTQNLTATNGTKVNINTADAKELMKVKGLSSSKAKAIVSYRKKHGDFKSTDDIKEIKGFSKLSDDQLKKITDQLTV